jgi:hypothetical protein
VTLSIISAGIDGVIHPVTSSDTSAAILSGSPAASIISAVLWVVPSLFVVSSIFLLLR